VVQSRVSEVQRLGNVLQDAGIKTDSVASSIAAKSGRAMIEALIDGERRPAALADRAPGKMRARIPDLELALEGRFDDHHVLMCRLHLDHTGLLDEMIAKLDAQVEAMMAPFRAERELLTTIPGTGALAAAAVISGIGASPASSSPTPPTWRRGPGSARATTSRPGNGTPAAAGTATCTCSRSWWRPPGQRSATTATSRPSTTGTS
jgi:transposase